MMKDCVRIVVVGDDGVGKSSLITAFLTDEFPNAASLAHVMAVSTISPEAVPDHVRTNIVDTSVQNEDHLSEAIAGADCVCLCYKAVSGPDSERTQDDIVANIRSWLQHVRSIRAGNAVPVILVGTQIDQRAGVSSPDQVLDPARIDLLEDKDLNSYMQPIMSEFTEVESCIECSSLLLLNVQAAFIFAQKAVLYPIAVLWNAKEDTLQPACSAALDRIFRLVDQDMDGLLNDAELNSFQHECFGEWLDQGDLKAVKDLVRLCNPQWVLEGEGGGVTIDGFRYLHQLFIEKGQVETTWKVLRTWGYADNLRLAPHILQPSIYVDLLSEIQVEHPHTELTQSALTFLSTLFERYADGVIAHGDMEEPSLSLDAARRIFDNLSEAEPAFPWTADPNTIVQLPEADVLDYGAWHSLWQLLASMDWHAAVRALTYVGYTHAEPAVAFYDSDDNSYKLRSVFHAFVFGSQACGKSSMVRTFLHPEEAPRTHYTPSLEGANDTLSPVRTAVRWIPSPTAASGGHWLLLSEFSETTTVLEDEDRMCQCDIALLMYKRNDDTSWAYVERFQGQMLQRANLVLPVCYLQSHSDVDLAAKAEPAEGSSGPTGSIAAHIVQHCEKLHIAPPQPISFVSEDRAEVCEPLWSSVVQVCIDAKGHIPVARRRWPIVALGTVSALVLAGGGWFLWRWWSGRATAEEGVGVKRDGGGGGQ